MDCRINARPIQNFEDLQRTASSMFVGIFEKMFNVDLKHAVRKPSMVAHYIKNAKIVIHGMKHSGGRICSAVSFLLLSNYISYTWMFINRCSIKRSV